MIDRITLSYIVKEIEQYNGIVKLEKCEETNVLDALSDSMIRSRINAVVASKNKILNIKTDLLEDSEAIVMITYLININKSNKVKLY